MSEPKELEEWGTEWGVQRPEPFEGVITDSMMTEAEANRSAKSLESRYTQGPWLVVSRKRYVGPWERA